jgi:hypothetical protein
MSDRAETFFIVIKDSLTKTAFFISKNMALSTSSTFYNIKHREKEAFFQWLKI